MDPFILREKFQGARSSNLSSASLSGAILPGEGIEKAGKEATEGMKKLFDIARRRAQNQNVLDARKNTLKMTKELLHSYDAFEVTSKVSLFREQWIVSPVVEISWLILYLKR